ncbi:hypothetical protein [Desulfosporosinus sp. FKA]|uniref:hypothetical protein n=1 Tax=Desulfosporosinus sp. FKA TaxID=1969834 RepID=UPI000B4A30E1|nr:hypothetical protein [Desulfosporosinus sp. FKA]
MIILSYILFIVGIVPFLINNRIEVFILSSLILVIALIMMAIGSKRLVSKNIVKRSLQKQFIAVVIITALLFIAQAGIRDASPFPFMAWGSWIALFINLIFTASFKLLKKGSSVLVVCFVLVLTTVSFAHYYPHSVQWSDTNKFERNLEFQFAYNYNNAIYYASSRRGGIYKTTSNGETLKLVDSRIPTYEGDITLWVIGNEAYFKYNSENWKSINLDTLGLRNQPDFKVDNSAYQKQKYSFIGDGTVQDKIGYVTGSQVGTDGYIYFLTGSTHEGIKQGIYRVKINSNEYELLVESENITMFDVSNGLLSYYDSHKTPPISKLQLEKD